MIDAPLSADETPIRPLRPSSLAELRAAVATLAERVPLGLPRFLLAGGAMSAINWLARFPLSLVMPFWPAVAVAYGVGMVCGFTLYRTWVFPGSTLPIGSQIVRFILVNLAGMTTVIVGAAALVGLLRPSGLLPPAAAEGLAHAIAIAGGATVNFLGHRAVTFARRPAPAAGLSCAMADRGIGLRHRVAARPSRR